MKPFRVLLSVEVAVDGLCATQARIYTGPSVDEETVQVFSDITPLLREHGEALARAISKEITGSEDIVAVEVAAPQRPVKLDSQIGRA